MYKKTTFNNGLTLVTHNMRDVYSVSVGLWFKVGSRYENDSIAGISHFLEHIVFKGSRKYDGDTIKRQIEGRGGSLNAFTSEEYTCYLAKIPHKRIGDTYNILLDMVLNPRLKDLDIERERTVIIEEIKMYRDLPQHIAHDLLGEIMWPKHPLGRNIAGSIDTVKGLSKDDINNYQKHFYLPKNMVIVFAGNINHNACLNLVKKSLGLKVCKVESDTYCEFESRQKSVEVKIQPKEIEQVRIALGFHAYKRSDPRRMVLTLLSVILGGNMSSRLFSEVREKRGLVYAISSNYKKLLDTGVFFIQAGLDVSKVDLALELTLKELVKLKKTLVPDPELIRAKEFCLGQIAMGLEDTMEHMVFLGESEISMGKIDTFNQIKKRVQAVTSADIRSVAKDIFKNDASNMSLVGPVKDDNPKKYMNYISNALG